MLCFSSLFYFSLPNYSLSYVFTFLLIITPTMWPYMIHHMIIFSFLTSVRLHPLHVLVMHFISIITTVHCCAQITYSH